MAHNRIRRSAGEMTFDFINVLFMVCLCLSIVYPFIQQINTSVATAEDSMRFGLKLIPRSFSLASYKRIFDTGQITRAYWFTIVRTALGTSLGMVLMSALAFPLAKRYLPLRNLWTSLVVITMFFSGGLIPTYFLIRNLGMIDTIWALILPGLVEPFNLIIMRNYFMSLPEEMDESAKIDGATEVRIFTSIILPLSKPILATVALWTIVGHWNAWFDALIYIQTPRIKVIQLVLQRVLLESNMSYAGIGSDVLVGQATEDAARQFTPDTIKAAILIISTLPILCVYPFLQKYFVKGIMMGSLKG
jgi:putative aldouronate transport system permease protein